MVFFDLKPVIRRGRVLARLGYTEKTNLTERVDNLIESCINEAATLFNPKGCYKDLEVKQITEGMVEFEGFVINSRDVAALLKNCKKATLFAVTIGFRMEQKITELANKPAEASILDAIGSETADELAEQANTLLTERAKEEGCTTTMRFSCGYGDWKLEAQQKIISILNAKDIGITLTQSNILIPQKSVTALVGWKNES